MPSVIMRPAGREKPRPVKRGYQLPVSDELTCPCGRKFRARFGMGDRCSTFCAERWPSPTKKPRD